MQKSSWMMLGIVAALSAFLAFGYISSHSDPGPLTETQANALLDTLKDAVARKDANTILGAIAPAPETRIYNLPPDSFRSLLYQAFRTADKLDAQTTNLVFHGDAASAAMEFKLTVHHTVGEVVGNWDYNVTMQLRPIETAHFLGLYHTKEWRIVGAAADGPDAGSFLD